MIYLTIRVACVISSASFNSRKVSLYVQLVFVCSFLRDSLSHNLVFQAVMFKLSEGCEFFFLSVYFIRPEWAKYWPCSLPAEHHWSKHHVSARGTEFPHPPLLKINSSWPWIGLAIMTQGFTPIPATSAVGIELGMELKPYLMPWQLLAWGSVQFPSTAHPLR